MTRSFIVGNRVKYYSPVSYFFLMITVMLLLMSLLDVDIIEFLKAAGKYAATVPEDSERQAKLNESVLKLASDNIKVLSFAMIPLQAFCSRYLYFRKSGFSFLEHTVMPFYVQGHIYWLSIMNVIYYKAIGEFFPPAITALLGIIFFGFAYSDLFNYQSRIKGFFKGLGVYFTAQIIFGLIIAIIVFTLVLISPEIREMIKPSNTR